jgi:hypothetical protein
VKLVRSWPAAVPPQRAHVVDAIEHLTIDGYDYSPLRQAHDDVLLLEWDIAVSQEDLRAFAEQAQASPEDLLVAPYRLYPEGSGWPVPVWAHRRDYLTFVEEGEPTCVMFGLGMIYLPKRLIDAFDGQVFDDGRFSEWHHSTVGKPVPIAWNVRPVHLNYRIPEL